MSDAPICERCDGEGDTGISMSGGPAVCPDCDGTGVQK